MDGKAQRRQLLETKRSDLAYWEKQQAECQQRIPGLRREIKALASVVINGRR
jgi:hypothetical protein